MELHVDYQAITESIRKDLDSVERLIVENLGSQVPLIPRVGEHVFGAGGKRFRPALLLLCARLAGYQGLRAHNLATVIEFVHTASLLHDDVVDNARLRRGREAANLVYGNQASVLVGDFLYGRASSMLADDGDIRTVKVVAEALRAMAEGEVMQLGRQHDMDTTEVEYIAVVADKTGVLISAASELGAILGEREGEEREALRAFGFTLGIAFQLMDDALDYVADEKLFGKATGNDLAEGKVTLPLIWTLKACTLSERETINAVFKSGPPGLEDFRAVVALIHRYGGIERTVAQAREYVTQGRRRLDIFPDGAEKDALRELSNYVVARER
ncbi:MAG: octaprenyl diphosphate synthase [Deltaproteobacteria bacterium RBG_13_65_10]|nr:MAG: octaprenyl diphosphate synthase [Deltaproteobacteria bacterium RBG_13_65_10]